MVDIRRVVVDSVQMALSNVASPAVQAFQTEEADFKVKDCLCGCLPNMWLPVECISCCFILDN